MGFLFAIALVHTHLYDAFLVSIGMNDKWHIVLYSSYFAVLFEKGRSKAWKNDRYIISLGTILLSAVFW
jgi:hypothetical protein